ncbi:hypothetical protein C0991_001472, partial [Blastosporella zonata]
VVQRGGQRRHVWYGYHNKSYRNKIRTLRISDAILRGISAEDALEWLDPVVQEVEWDGSDTRDTTWLSEEELEGSESEGGENKNGESKDDQSEDGENEHDKNEDNENEDGQSERSENIYDKNKDGGDEDEDSKTSDSESSYGESESAEDSFEIAYEDDHNLTRWLLFSNLDDEMEMETREIEPTI